MRIPMTEEARKAKIRQYNRKYYLNDPEKYRKRSLTYYFENREKINENKRKRHLKNKEQSTRFDKSKIEIPKEPMEFTASEEMYINNLIAELKKKPIADLIYKTEGKG